MPPLCTNTLPAYLVLSLYFADGRSVLYPPAYPKQGEEPYLPISHCPGITHTVPAIPCFPYCFPISQAACNSPPPPFPSFTGIWDFCHHATVPLPRACLTPACSCPACLPATPVVHFAKTSPCTTLPACFCAMPVIVLCFWCSCTWKTYTCLPPFLPACTVLCTVPYLPGRLDYHCILPPPPIPISGRLCCSGTHLDWDYLPPACTSGTVPPTHIPQDLFHAMLPFPYGTWGFHFCSFIAVLLLFPVHLLYFPVLFCHHSLFTAFLFLLLPPPYSHIFYQPATTTLREGEEDSRPATCTHTFFYTTLLWDTTVLNISIFPVLVVFLQFFLPAARTCAPGLLCIFHFQHFTTHTCLCIIPWDVLLHKNLYYHHLHLPPPFLSAAVFNTYTLVTVSCLVPRFLYCSSHSSSIYTALQTL